jgi:heterodisulfide reductase subunit B
MKYGYYPGCSLQGISSEYDESVRSLLDRLEVKTEDVPDWICCGTIATPSTSHFLGLAVPLWNLVQARQAGFDQVITPCSACLYHFKHAAYRVAEDPALRAEVESVLEQPLDPLPPAVHPLETLSTDAFKARIKAELVPERDLSTLKAVCYYGCHISRPAKIMQFDDPENPQSMDRMLKWANVQVLDWPGKVDCCGAHFSLVKPEIVVDSSLRLFESALAVGAEAIVSACPMCQANLDMRQDTIGAKLGQPLSMPVLYFSQVLGYALGLEVEPLGLNKHFVDPTPLLLAKSQKQQALT